MTVLITILLLANTVAISTSCGTTLKSPPSPLPPYPTERTTITSRQTATTTEPTTTTSEPTTTTTSQTTTTSTGSTTTTSSSTTTAPITAVSHPLLFPYGDFEGDTRYPRREDDTFQRFQLSAALSFFGSQWNELFISTNGIVSVNRGVSEYETGPFPLGNGWTIISAFWEDIDIRKGGMVFYRETTNAELLSEATKLIVKEFPKIQHFKAKWVFIHTNHRVAAYQGNEGKRNTFQLALVSDGYYTFSIFNYADIEWWNTGTGSGAQVGFNAGNNKTFFAVPGSRTAEMANLASSSNIGVPGRWIFRVDGGGIESAACGQTDQHEISLSPRFGPAMGGTIVTISGPCFDEVGQFVCKFGKLQTKGKFVSKNSIQCVTPNLLYMAGFNDTIETNEITVQVSQDNGVTYPMRAQFATLDDVFYKADIQLKVVKRRYIELSWSGENVPAQANLEMVLISPHYPSETVVVLQRNLDARASRYRVPFIKIKQEAESLELIDLSAIAFRIKQSDTSTKVDHSERWWVSDAVFDTLDYIKSINLFRSKQVCEQWAAKQALTPRFWRNLTPCPCSRDQALSDPNFESDIACLPTNTCPFHRGAYHCFRSREANSIGACQQCCYDRKDRLLVNDPKDVNWKDGDIPRGGGTADKSCSSHWFFWKHLMEDVSPYMHCCEWSNSNRHCAMYLKYRPSNDCSGYQPPGTGTGVGDPHIFTLDGLQYSFNGIGEYTILETTDKNIILQGRTIQATGKTSSPIKATVWQAIVLKAGSDIVQIETNQAKGVLVSINGTEVEFNQYSMQKLNQLVVLQEQTDQTYRVIVKHKVGISIICRVTDQVLNFITTVDHKYKKKTRGLLGVYNGDQRDDLTKPDGTILSINSTESAIFRQFGNLWRTDPSTSIFTYEAEETHADYQDYAFVPTFSYQIENKITADMKETCSNNRQCMFDYAVTGKVAVANETLNTVQFHKKQVEIQKPIVVCPVLITPRNGRKFGHSISVNSTVLFSCKPGYNIRGTARRLCEPSGKWSGTGDVRCEKIKEENPNYGFWAERNK